MCNFLSAIVLRNGDVLSHPMLDSHTELVQHFRLPDTRAHHQHFAKAELTPEGDWLDASTWQFRLDEETAPGWWADVSSQAEATLRARAEKMIMKTGEHSLLIDGCWIIGGDAVVRDVRAGRVRRVSGGTISGVSGGTISEVRGGSISGVWGGTISGVWGLPWEPLLDDSAKAHVATKPAPAKKRPVKA